ncbi:type II secretion system F family protein [Nocardioides sp. CFH 31398]|uniref:type II secretion system F family protein n=1 Tax=Nocardioides sp. CFH 31398 TaxID=2919579 RepID=UPI001F066CCA|nr:type II secretion system F family protein [Nocardioides sp. CFH 31398]MCH1867759.1 type II secretion system F family protein [Nocardioides sp. CFH 31398]
MSPAVVLSAVALGCAVLLARVSPVGSHGRAQATTSSTGAPADLLRRTRWATAPLAAVGALVVVPGPVAPVAALAAGAGVWVLASRAEPSSARRAREAARRDLASLVDLFAGALAAGAPPGRAVRVVCEALPGPAADRLAGVVARLELGVAPEQVWSDLAADPVLGPLGRTLARAESSGASVATAVGALADDLAGQARAEVEDRARAVGVRAALPLGLCLLPAFLLLGVVPMVAGMVAGLL